MTSYLDEVFQILLDLSQDRVWGADFDLWVLPLGVKAVSHNFAGITVAKRRELGVRYQRIHLSKALFSFLTSNHKCTVIIKYYIIYLWL